MAFQRERAPIPKRNGQMDGGSMPQLHKLQVEVAICGVEYEERSPHCQEEVATTLGLTPTSLNAPHMLETMPCFLGSPSSGENSLLTHLQLPLSHSEVRERETDN